MTVVTPPKAAASRPAHPWSRDRAWRTSSA